MNTRIKPTYLKAIDAPKKFSILVQAYDIYRGTNEKGEEYEYDYVLATMEKVPRRVNLNQASVLFLAANGFEPSEEGLKELEGATLWFETHPSGRFMSYSVVKVKPATKQKKVEE